MKQQLGNSEVSSVIISWVSDNEKIIQKTKKITKLYLNPWQNRHYRGTDTQQHINTDECLVFRTTFWMSVINVKQDNSY